MKIEELLKKIQMLEGRIIELEKLVHRVDAIGKSVDRINAHNNPIGGAGSTCPINWNPEGSNPSSVKEETK